MAISNPEVESKYRALGFRAAGLGLRLTIADVELDATEHPWKGIEIGFTCITPRKMTQFAVGLPAHCAVEQIATLIYLNFRSAFSDRAETCKQHFEKISVKVSTEGLPI
jgi:hypothetical protein